MYCYQIGENKGFGICRLLNTENILRSSGLTRTRLLRQWLRIWGIAPSYLSAIESGERVIPVDFTEKISEKYSLDDVAKDELRELELKTPRNALQLDFKKSGSTEEQKNLAILFAQKYAGLSAEQIEKIRAVLEEK